MHYNVIAYIVVKIIFSNRHARSADTCAHFDFVEGEVLLRLKRNPMHPFLYDDVIVYIVVIITFSNRHTLAR